MNYKLIIKLPQIFCVISIFLLFSCSGCEVISVGGKKRDKVLDIAVYENYIPAKVHILPLTERTRIDEEYQKLNIYVSLTDEFGCQVKSPGVFRFELYEYVPRSANPKGRRIFIWPDIDLADKVGNNNHWQDFLRGYQFNLELSSRSDLCVLQVTFVCPGGKRLLDERSI